MAGWQDAPLVEQPSLRPFDPKRDKPRANADGSYSTEILRTVQTPTGWANVPGLWWGEDGPAELGDYSDDELARLALSYEKDSGSTFPRFNTVNEAESAAKNRSAKGGATQGSLAAPKWAGAPEIEDRPDPFSGDPLLSNEAMGKLAAGERSTVTPTQRPSLMDRATDYVGEYVRGVGDAATATGKTAQPETFAERIGNVPILGPLYGTGETALALGSGMLSPLAAFADPKNPEAAAQRAIYEPRSAPGKALTGLVGAAAKPAVDVAQKTGADVALMPLAAEAQAMRAGAQHFRDARALKAMAKEPKVPTTADLGAAKSALYKQAEQSGVVIKPEATARSAQIFRQVAEKENLGKLPPKLSEAVGVLDDRVAAGKPLTLSDADKVRQLINDALKSTDAGDRRLASIIKTQYDNYLDALGPQDTLAGDATQAIAVLKAARDVNRRFENSRMLDATIKKAERSGDAKFTQAGEEHALRTEFKNLAGNEKKMRVLTPEQRAAVEAVSRGGATRGRRMVANTARNLGKFDPTSGGMASLVSLGTGSLATGMTGNPLGLTLPAAGYLSKRLATRLTRGNVDRAREALVGRGMPPSAEQLGEALRRSSMVREPIAGEVMSRAPLALPAPSMVASMRSAPGTAFSREQMGLTPDVERAGALHPGVAREPIAPLSRTPALPFRQAPAAVTDQRPMVVDAQGRVSATREQLRDYLRETGQERTRNVRQPRAEPTQPARIVEPEQTSGAPQVMSVQQLEAEARRMGLFESENPTPEQRLAESLWMQRWKEAKAREQGN